MRNTRTSSSELSYSQIQNEIKRRLLIPLNINLRISEKHNSNINILK